MPWALVIGDSAAGSGEMPQQVVADFTLPREADEYARRHGLDGRVVPMVFAGHDDVVWFRGARDAVPSEGGREDVVRAAAELRWQRGPADRDAETVEALVADLELGAVRGVGTGVSAAGLDLLAVDFEVRPGSVWRLVATARRPLCLVVPPAGTRLGGHGLLPGLTG